jgi:hypothetical protein
VEKANIDILMQEKETTDENLNTHLYQEKSYELPQRQ